MEEQCNLTANQVLELLKEGNKRYRKEGPVFKKLTFEKRDQLSKGQCPLAVFLSCSDSRVPLELIFNQSHGNLFVVRSAGNTFDTLALGSIEFGLLQLNIPLIVVMGHSNCGMIQATLNHIVPTKSIEYIANIIKPAIKDIQSNITGNIIQEAVIANVHYVVKQLKSASFLIKEYLESGKVTVIGAYYDIKTGNVNFFN